MTTNIEKVDFGRLDAETEEHLLEYFVDTGVISRLKNGERQYVIGRKGAGKTALFRRLGHDVLGHDVERLEFADYSWDAHKILAESGVTPESAYVASWRFTFLMTIIMHWSVHTSGALKNKSRRLVETIYGAESPPWYRLLFDKLRRVRRLDLPGIEGVAELGGIELDEKDNGPVLAASINLWSRKLLGFVKEHYQSRPVTLLLDRLDEGWDATEESKQMLTGAMKATRELNLALANRRVAAPIILFLRSDIFQYLQFNDKNKIGIDIEYLDWSEEGLFSVASARIARSLNCDRESAWGRAFSSKRMRQRANIRSYILKRTMLRPRDIVAFCTHCRNVAVKAGHSVVETDDVYSAEDAYSQHVYNELDDEMHKQLPSARESLQVLRDMEQQRFTLKDWVTALRTRLPSATEQEAIARLRELFDYSVVGVQRIGGKQRGTTFQFVYEDRLLQPNFGAQMVVHFSLKKALTMKDRGA